MRAVFRLIRLLIHAFCAVATGIFRYPSWDRARKRAYIQYWSKKMFRIIGIKIRVINQEQLAPHALIVSNHLCWLDIFLIHTAQPSRFVAKDSIRKWPLIGWLSTHSGTLYLKRDNPRDLRNTFKILAAELQKGDYFVVFPEGTAGNNQSNLLPFHANLFQAAIDANVPIQPCVVHYTDKNNGFHPAVTSKEKRPIVENILRTLALKNLEAELTVLPVIYPEGKDRRELAQLAHDMIKAEIMRHPAYRIPGNPPGQQNDPQDIRP